MRSKYIELEDGLSKIFNTINDFYKSVSHEDGKIEIEKFERSEPSELVQIHNKLRNAYSNNAIFNSILKSEFVIYEPTKVRTPLTKNDIDKGFCWEVELDQYDTLLKMPRNELNIGSLIAWNIYKDSAKSPFFDFGSEYKLELDIDKLLTINEQVRDFA